MVSEPAVSAAPPEVSETIGRLHAEVEKLQRELEQALEVWQSALGAEKIQFDEFVRHKELAWQEQENQWALQSRAYEERLEALKSDFESRLKQTEQNAARSLSELDDAWQHDKLEWGPIARDEWPAQKRALEEKVKGLEAELSEEKRLRAEEMQQAETRLREVSRSDELVGACVQALDYQISVLYDLVRHYTIDPAGQEPSPDLGQP